jgi:DNA-binding transcriptional LysR family regulator
MIENLGLFFHVVDSGGFTQASRRTGIGKATISRRISALEQELAVALLHRNARQLVMTEAGERLFVRARTIVEEAEAAKSEALDSGGEASGHLRISCPVVLAEVAVGRLAATFTRQNPRVRVTLNVSNQAIDPVAERFDVVIRPSTTPLADTSLCARRLYDATYGVVATPSLAAKLGAVHPDELADAPAVGWSLHGEPSWKLVSRSDGAESTLRVDARFSSDHLLVVRAAALEGLGIAFLPLALCRDEIANGALIRMLPDWSPPSMTIYAIYPSRRGLTPAARRFIEYLAEGLQDLG